MEQINLSSSINYIKGVGQKMATRFSRLGIETVEDLLYYYPRAYKDYSKITPISSLKSQDFGESFTIQGRILSIGNKRTSRRQFTITEALIGDSSGSIKVVWFNQPFLSKSLPVGREVILNGKVTWNFYSKEVVMESPARSLRPVILPIYSETAGLSSHYIWRVIVSIIDQVSSIDEYLPESLRKSFDLIQLSKALKEIHEPSDSFELERARRRIAFDELFLISLQANLSKNDREGEVAPKIAFSEPKIEQFAKELPFELTGDQKKSIKEILSDIAKKRPMNRLLNGDVGSGKTVVAGIASMVVVSAGFRVVLMAPTEILAAQHYATFCRLFSSQRGIKIGLWTSNKKTTNSNETGKIFDSQIIIGTQALIQKKVEIENVGLVIVDEQHRFGVKQRRALIKAVKNGLDVSGKEILPHFLSMTATPIPRTMQLALFGDLDVSIIKEKPSKRKEIRTRLVEERNRLKAYQFVREHLARGRQAYVICSLIEKTSTEDDDSLGLEDERKTVVNEYDKLSKVFPEFRISMLHGKMKAKEKEEVMNKFGSGENDILVSTSVVEVGVDVPNSTIMMVEDAERFGLAQLHQFRGRVGRGEHQSFCFLFSSTMSPKALDRLKALESTNDGFKLAEIDLKERGPGAIFGTDQSGVVDLKMASFTNLVLMQEASKAAKELLIQDPHLQKYTLIREKIEDFLKSKHME